MKDQGTQARRIDLPFLVLVAAIAVVFGRTLFFDFVCWDDDVNIFANSHFNPLTLAELGSFWAKPYGYFYMPVTYTLWAIQVALSPTVPRNDITSSTLDPQIFHGTNLLLHIGNVYLAFLILMRLLRRFEVKDPRLPALFGAMLMAVHPVQVEPVAWVSGFRDLCHGTFALLALWLYLKHLEAPLKRTYLAVLAVFTVAMLAKPNAASLIPTCLMIAVVLYRRPFFRTALSFAPHAAVTLALGYWTHVLQKKVLDEIAAPLWFRPFVMLDSFGFYLHKIVWPGELLFNYQRSPDLIHDDSMSLVFGAVPIFLTFFIMRLPAAFRRPCAFAWAFFLAWLLPTSGLLTFVSQIQSTVYDRYLYVALLGPAFLVGWLLDRWRRPAVRLAAALVLVAFGVRAFVQTAIWRNSLSLYTAWIEFDPASPNAYRDLAIAAARSHRFDISKKLLTKVSSLVSNFDKSEMGRLLDLASEAERDKAVTQSAVNSDANEELTTAEARLATDPHDYEALLHKGIALVRQRRFDEAAAYYENMVRTFPDSTTVHNNLGAVYFFERRWAQSREQIQIALRLDPNNPAARQALERLDNEAALRQEDQLESVDALFKRVDGVPPPQVRLDTRPFYADHDFPEFLYQDATPRPL